MKTEHRLVQVYDQVAEAFAARVDTRAHNAHYERPATLSLLPPVAGQRVLDAGCGPGVYCEWLAAHGASVVGIDSSPKMVALAQRRLGERGEIREADLAQPLSDFEAATFDGVLSALVLDYIRDWDLVLGEFHRVLKPSGWLVFSVDHPFDQFYAHPNGGDYFATEMVDRRWNWPELNGPVSLPQYRRPLSAITAALLAAGFNLERIVEPQPQPEFRLLEPAEYARLMRQPGFICFRAKVSN
jgi:ubiquinone/menaquinone biosynthesis C-methylase UbiE